MERVEVTRPFMSVEEFGLLAICTMQVCTVADATDEEILKTCNQKNLCGTTNGWSRVIREDTDSFQGKGPCEDYPERVHFLVTC